MLPTLRRRTPTLWENPLQREIARMFAGWPDFEPTESGMIAAYPMDVREDDEKIYVDAEMPGFRKEDIDVNLNNGMIEITAERQPEEFEGTTHVSERRYSRVQRSFTLPHAVDDSNIKATFQDGVLHVEMQKTEEGKGHKITVQ